MFIVYFDASALVKLLVEEPGSELASALWDGCVISTASRLAFPEVCAALAALGRSGAISEQGVASANALWAEYWPSVRAVEFSSAVEQQAGELARLHGLRGADAVHLSSALALGDPSVVVAVWDKALHAATRAAGLAVAPAVLPG